MSGDLLTLRMMLVTASDAAHELWRQGVALASLPIELNRVDPLAAKSGGTASDIVVFDAGIPAAERNAIIQAAADHRPVPLIAAVMPPGTDMLEGISVIFPIPANAAAVRALCERCIRMRLPKRVLVVDDSRTMRTIVRKILSASRFNLDVSEAEEGITAIKKLGDRYDVVLLDYNMPGFNGFETLTQIKRMAPGTAVIMMTANEDEAIGGRARDAGATAYLKKPFYPADIDAVLDRLYEVESE
jgi:CheY-like chemotaxis protein